MNMLFNQIGLKMFFCDTVGIPASEVARIFSRSGTLNRVFDFWAHLDLLNRVLGMVNPKIKLDTVLRSQAKSDGGER